MLAQTAFFVVLLSTIALGVLSSNLISAGVARQHQVAKYTTLAMDDAVDNFTSLVQSYVRDHGTQGPWPTAIPPSQPIPICAKADTTAATCPYTYRVTAKITGASGGATGNDVWGSAKPHAGNAFASNLQQLAVHEERISATVSIELDSAVASQATSARYLTLRVFSGSPYAMVSGQRDANAQNGGASSLEGDNGGIKDLRHNYGEQPNPTAPDVFHDSTIRVVFKCATVDAIVGSNTSTPNHNQGRGNRGLPWGVGAVGGYELPCTNTFATPIPGVFHSESWTNGNGSSE